MRLLTYNGETKSVKKWSEIIGINYDTLMWRVKHKWSVEDSLTKSTNLNYSIHHTPKYEYKGEVKTLTEHQKTIGLNKKTIYSRLKKNQPLESPLKRFKNKKVLDRGVELWHQCMCQYFTKEHRIKCYKKLKTDYEDIKREAMTRAA